MPLYSCLTLLAILNRKNLLNDVLMCAKGVKNPPRYSYDKITIWLLSIGGEYIHGL
jgi:hypothetical protein